MPLLRLLYNLQHKISINDSTRTFTRAVSNQKKILGTVLMFHLEKAEIFLVLS